MANYIIVDYMNMAHRAKNAQFNSDVDTQIGMAMHIMFNSIKKVNNQFNGDHVIVCTEGNSWRKQYYSGYKKNRILKKMQKTPQEQEDDQIFMEAMDEMEVFMREKTNVTVLNHKYAEADDMIAIFVQSHPDDNHFIISSDTDYIQCLDENVVIFNGVSEQILCLDGYFDLKGKPIKDKNGNIKEMPEPRYSLFEKCIRGDSSDNIFTAYPRVRTKGTKNKVGIIQAYADMDTKGFDWNNFMQTKWTDHEGIEHTVQDKYEFNKLLIDLTMQPEDIKEECLIAMAESLAKERITGVGVNFLRFCGLWNLIELAKYPDEIASLLNKSYVL
jgi:5'-3' exonuclease